MKKYDVAVIGAGPSGMMAAGRAAELGAKVVLLEKNSDLGIKLLMSGGGRCNFTNQSSVRSMVEKIGPNGFWLISALSYFGPNQIIDFFESRGIKTKVEDHGRVFPITNNAKGIKNSLIAYLKNGKVDIKTKSELKKFVKDKNTISKIVLSDGGEIVADKFIVACGGKSYPFSGSNGDTYSYLLKLGHKIIEPRPALSQIIFKEKLPNLEGLSLSEASLFIYEGKKIIAEENGDIIFTNLGLSGPAALNLSRKIKLLNKSDLFIDFFPEDSREDLELKLKLLISQNSRSDIKNVLNLILPKRLSLFILSKLNIKETKKANLFKKSEIIEIVNFLKNNRFEISALGGFDQAMITLGGVDLKEVNPKTMASKIITNLYLAGEILDLDGPTGGYNLQIAWTTGYLAGESVVKEI